MHCPPRALTTVGALLLAAASAHAFPMTNGARANEVVGRPDFVSGFVDFAVDDFFGGGTSRTRLFVPTDIDYDEANERVFVADLHNHRYLVFDASSGIPTNLAAAFVLGQPDFTTGGADATAPYGHQNSQNPAAGCTTAVNACGVRRAYAVAYDGVRQRLFAADPDNHRVLVWNLAAGITNGMAAQYVLGQARFTSDARNSACGGATAGTTNACGLSFPSELEYDAATQRLYVADTDNHRVVVFNLAAGITNGMAAATVLGQPDLTRATANTACGGASAGAASACGLASPTSLSVDPGGFVYVGDADNHRVLVFNTTSLATGMAASRVLGQPNFTTATTNTACGGGASGEQNTNACGLGVYGASVEIDEGHDVLYVADAANHRILAFDVATITNGEAATRVLGQGNLATGYDPNLVALGGATARDRLILPMGLDYDPINDRLIVTDSGNHRLTVFGANVGGEPIAVAGNEESTTTTVNANGTTTVGVTTENGDAFTVVLPPGTTPLPGQDITITVDDAGNNRPRVRVDAKLPPGTTKTIILPKRSGRELCIVDKTHAQFTQHPASCSGNVIQGPAQAGRCASFIVNGDRGDGGDPVNGRHTIKVCVDASGSNFVISGLLHSMVETMPASGGDGDDELEGDGEVVDELDTAGVETGGCDAGGTEPRGALAALALAVLGLALTSLTSRTSFRGRRATSRASRVRRAPRSRP